MDWLSVQLSGQTTPAGTVRLLQQVGISATGIKSVEENEITGSMLLQFCEDDIKDAFSVFKDRFLVRKILRSTKRRVADDDTNIPTPTTASVNGISQTLSYNDDHRERYNTFGEMPAREMSQMSRDDEELAAPQIPHSSRLEDMSPSSANSYHGLSHESLSRFRSSPLPHSNMEQMKDDFRLNQDGSPLRKRIALYVSSASNEPSMSPNMTDSHGSSSFGVVSGFDNYRPFYNSEKDMTEDGAATYKMRVPCDLATDIRPSIKREIITPETNTMNRLPLPSNKLQDVNRDNEETSASIDSGTDSAIDTKDWYLEETNDVIDVEQHEELKADRSQDAPKHTANSEIGNTLPTREFSPSLCYRNPAQHYTAEELMSKKEVRTKANAAQRAGQMLIRTAAHAAGLWENVPLLKDITPSDRDVFFGHVFAAAPHLANHTQLVWQKLKEALLNRRKYLLDKELGKRMTKREREMMDAS